MGNVAYGEIRDWGLGSLAEVGSWIGGGAGKRASSPTSIMHRFASHPISSRANVANDVLAETVASKWGKSRGQPADSAAAHVSARSRPQPASL